MEMLQFLIAPSFKKNWSSLWENIFLSPHHFCAYLWQTISEDNSILTQIEGKMFTHANLMPPSLVPFVEMKQIAGGKQ